MFFRDSNHRKAVGFRAGTMSKIDRYNRQCRCGSKLHLIKRTSVFSRILQQYRRAFACIYRAAAAHFSQILQDAPANGQSLDVLPAGMAILSCLSKSLTDYLLRDLPGEKADK